MAWVAAAIGAGGALLGYKSSKDATKAAQRQQDQAIAAQKEAAKMDPRVEGHIFGNGTTDMGLLNNFRGMFDDPQKSGINAFERANDAYLGYGATEDGNKLRATAHAQMNNGDRMAPQINAPGQNNVNTQGAYDRLINGNAGENPYLRRALDGAMAQSGNVFSQMQDSATENLKENILPGIRSNSVLSGQYGGSRQGVAEGNAIGDFAKAQQQTINQFGQNNTNAAVGAQAQAFNQGQDRTLAATTNLSGQQYGAATNNAGLQMQQQGMNDARVQTGALNLQGLIGNAYNTGQNHDSYDLNRSAKINGLMAPYMNQNGSNIQVPQPLYSNSAGGALGGAMAGLSIANMFSKPPTLGQTGPTNTNPWPT